MKKVTFLILKTNWKKIYIYTQAFSTALHYLQLGLWNMGMLLYDWSHHYISLTVVIMNSWIVTMHPSAAWGLIWSMCQIEVFLSSFVEHGLFYEQFRGYCSKGSGRLPYLCTCFMLRVFKGAQVAPLVLFLCIYHFGWVMFFVVHVFCPCLSFI